MCCPHSIREGKPEILTISLTHLGTWSQAVARAHISEGLTQSWGRQLTQLPCTTTLLYSSNICYLFDPPQYLYESSTTIIHSIFSDSSQRTAFLIHPPISSRHRLFDCLKHPLFELPYHHPYLSPLKELSFVFSLGNNGLVVHSSCGSSVIFCSGTIQPPIIRYYATFVWVLWNPHILSSGTMKPSYIIIGYYATLLLSSGTMQPYIIVVGYYATLILSLGTIQPLYYCRVRCRLIQPYIIIIEYYATKSSGNMYLLFSPVYVQPTILLFEIDTFYNPLWILAIHNIIWARRPCFLIWSFRYSLFYIQEL